MADSGLYAWADSNSDARWLSYDDLVEVTGIKRESVTRMVRRKKWPKRTGNERGSVRVAVPVDAIEAMQARKNTRPPPLAEAIAPDIRLDLSDIARELDKLEATLTEIRAERDQLRSELGREREAATQARQIGEQNRAAAAEERLKTADQRARLTAQVNALAAELARMHAFPRVAKPERSAVPVPLLARVSTFARWLRS